MSSVTASKPCLARISTVRASGTPDHAVHKVSSAARRDFRDMGAFLIRPRIGPESARCEESKLSVLGASEWMHVALMQFSRKQLQRQRKTARRGEAVDWSSVSTGSEQGSGVLDLLDCLRHQIVHGAANLVVRLDDPGFVEILADLAENVVVAGFLDIGENDLAGIGFGVGPGLAELFGGPQAERLVAAGRGFEPEFLVDYEFSLEALLAIFHAAHGIPPVKSDLVGGRNVCIALHKPKGRGPVNMLRHLLRCGISFRKAVIERICRLSKQCDWDRHRH
ncbi:hypothetical protein MES4922_310071 [Mesorhizobium ventifaucium]|uniref:Uncharacterized protein n=1 Tax=Mesorhizobium ventifaucium TaxID=666020 RepID=A0ABM9E3Q4_9HYPH|nr:hypothetical protein MES4922_310071 [Mesorhizobium ventifaucium]